MLHESIVARTSASFPCVLPSPPSVSEYQIAIAEWSAMIFLRSWSGGTGTTRRMYSQCVNSRVGLECEAGKATVRLQQ